MWNLYGSDTGGADRVGPDFGVELPVWQSMLCILAIAALALLVLGLAGPIVLLGVAVCAALFIASLMQPMLAVAAYAVIVVTNAADVATDFHGAPPIGGLLVPGLLLLLLARRAAGLEDLTASILLILPSGAYLATQSIGLLWVEDPLPTIATVSDLLKNLIIAVVLCGFLTSVERLRTVCLCLGVAAVGLAALSVFQYSSGSFGATFFGFATANLKNIAGEVDSWRLQGPLPDPNYFGQLLVMTLPLAASMAFASRSALLRIMGAVGTPLIVAAIFLTFSRGALVGLAGLVVVAVLLTRQRIFLIVAVTLAALALMAASPALVTDRVMPIFDALDTLLSGSQAISDPALAQRFNVLEAGFAMVANEPIFGIGTGQFQDQYPLYALQNGLDLGAPSQAHNTYLELAAEQGLFGVVVFTAVMGGILAAGFSAVRRFRASGHYGEAALVFGLLMGILGYLITALFLHDDYTRVFWLFASLVIAAFFISVRCGDHVKERND